MSQFEALVFTFKAVMVCMLIVGIAVFLLAMRYEWQDRRRKRARRGMVEIEPQPLATIHPLAMARSRRDQRRGAA